MGPSGQGTPHVSDTKQSSGAAGHCAAAARRRRASPVVRSSWYDLHDLANLLSRMVGPIADPRANGGGHGGVEVRVDGETPVWATVARTDAAPSITELRRSYLVP